MEERGALLQHWLQRAEDEEIDLLYNEVDALEESRASLDALHSETSRRALLSARRHWSHDHRTSPRTSHCCAGFAPRWFSARKRPRSWNHT